MRPAEPAVSKLRAARKTAMQASLFWVAGGLLLVLILTAALATGGRGERLVAEAENLRGLRLAVPALPLGVVHLQGASTASEAEILRAVGLKPGRPLLGIDLAAVRARVERVGWVEHARIIRLLPDTLVVVVKERPLMAVWEHAGKTAVVARDGAVVGAVDPGHFTALPRIVGDGANLAAPALLPLIVARPDLARRLTALVRVDRRRWNLNLVDGGVVLLPAEDEAAALKRFDGLQAASRILELGLARIDLRDPNMVVVRPRMGAAPTVAARGV